MDVISNHIGAVPQIGAAGNIKTATDKQHELRPQKISSGAALKQAEISGEVVNISDQQLIKAIEKAIKSIEGSVTSLQFSVHEKTKKIMVKVLNKETGDVIREIPPEKTLDFVAKMWEMAGILVDERR